MRITGGTLGGRALITPQDERVRPTSDKVRQAIFNVLKHNDFGTGFSLEGARVIDLFAGTGALGIEALSHGASFALFVEEAPDSRAVIRDNIEALSLTGVTKIWRRDATDLGPMSANSGGPFDLAFLDPPYRKNLLEPALVALRDGGWLADPALVIAESADDETAPEADGFALLDHRVYGETRVAFLRK
jgi:16S rRNA (guanine966-N2)-methyltransferase